MRAKMINITGHFVSNILPQHNTNITYHYKNDTHELRNISIQLCLYDAVKHDQTTEEKLTVLKMTSAFWNVLTGWCRLFYLSLWRNSSLFISNKPAARLMFQRSEQLLVLCGLRRGQSPEQELGVYPEQFVPSFNSYTANWYIYIHI